MDALDQAKKAAATAAINDHVKDKQVIGMGSGSTMVYSMERLAQRVKDENLEIHCIPTSFLVKQSIRFHGLCLGDLEEFPSIDVMIDGADEVDQDKVLIKGGGGYLTQEKIIAAASHKMIIVADYSKKSTRLGQHWKKGITIEVIPMAFDFVRNRIQSQFGGKATLRQGKTKYGPINTDNSNFLLDWVFDSDKKHNWAEVEAALNMIPGVVDCGLFVNRAHQVYFGESDGSVSIV